MIIQAAEHRRRCKVFFVNAHCVNVGARNHNYLQVIHSCDLLFADGIGMATAGLIAGTKFCDNVNGTDLFPLICEQASKYGISIGLIGGRPGIAQKCGKVIKDRFRDLNITYINHGYFGGEEEEEIIAQINKSGTQILLVGFGVPTQEFWIARSAPSLEVPVLIGVGGLFDFYSGAISRAPLALRKLGMEWAFRLWLEPRRLFQRYVVGNPVFIARTLRLRLSGKESLRQGGHIFASRLGCNHFSKELRQPNSQKVQKDV